MIVGFVDCFFNILPCFFIFFKAVQNDSPDEVAVTIGFFFVDCRSDGIKGLHRHFAQLLNSGAPVIHWYESQTPVYIWVGCRWSHLGCILKLLQSFRKSIVECCNYSFEQAFVVLWSIVQLIAMPFQCLQIVQRMGVFTLAEVAIRSETVSQWSDVLVHVLFLDKLRQNIDSFFYFLFH